MSIKNNKNITLILLIVSIIIFSFFIYKTTVSSKEYMEKENTLNHILLIEKIDYIINQIEKEKIYSAVYLAMKKSSTRNQVDSSRKLVDHEIEETLMFLNKISNTKQMQKTIEELEYTLQIIKTYPYPKKIKIEQEKILDSWKIHKKILTVSSKLSLPSLLSISIQNFKDNIKILELYHKKNQ